MQKSLHVVTKQVVTQLSQGGKSSQQWIQKNCIILAKKGAKIFDSILRNSLVRLKTNGKYLLAFL